MIQEITGNKNMLDYLVDRVIDENEQYYKKVNNDLIREIQQEKGKVLDLEHKYSDLLGKFHDLEDENRIMGKANSELKFEIRKLRTQLKEKK